MQLDLFEHSGNVALQNDVIAALSQRDAVACPGAVAALEAKYGDDFLLPAFNVLCKALHSSLPAPLVREDASAILQDYKGDVAAAARRVFGSKAQDWLSPLWMALAAAIADYQFDPACPELHAAPMQLKARCWGDAVASVERIVAWRWEPEPLAWMLEATLWIDGIDAIWPLLAELAWMAPQKALDLVRRLAQPELDRLVSRFSEEFDGEGTADEFAWFPAWALVVVRGLAESMRPALRGTDSPAERCARILLDLRALERQGRHDQIVKGRRQLSEAHLALFKRYMQN